ncbi:MAG: alkaline phosphatase family protein [Maribacter sp.]|nr:alkaline phosphatase family protein [Maribacter sp.]
MSRKISTLPFFIVLLFAGALTSFGQKNAKSQIDRNIKSSPKLVVGIVVDQMRYDYLTRFWDHYSDGGFKRMINGGYNCKNNHFNYAPTTTGPGHASVYTGTTPATHGIIANDWYDKESGASVYCAGDDSYTSVGTMANAGQMSPHRMNVTTLADELRMATQLRGKTIAIAIKDRGAVLPGGHTANAAYWFYGANEGHWITSSYYMADLPKWVNDFNASNKIKQYKKAWTTLGDITTYLESGPDNNAYEGLFQDETMPTFPHSTPSLLDKEHDFEILKSTPFGNSMTADFAIAALEAEDLGGDMITDFLAISFSSTDYVGHKYGVNSKEVQDTYLRLDEDLERLLKALDKKVGNGEYTVFLTADHGASEVSAYLKDLKIPAGYFDANAMNIKLNEFLKFTYGTEELIKSNSNYQLFLDHMLIKNLDLNLSEVEETIAQELLNYDGIDRAYSAHQMWQNDFSEGIAHILQEGYNQERSGDVLYVLKPGFTNYTLTGSTHGSPQIYDTHVPLLFYGKGIRNGHTERRTEIPDIAPTMATLLGIAFPNGTTGNPIVEVLE